MTRAILGNDTDLVGDDTLGEGFPMPSLGDLYGTPPTQTYTTRFELPVRPGSAHPAPVVVVERTQAFPNTTAVIRVEGSICCVDEYNAIMSLIEKVPA